MKEIGGSNGFARGAEWVQTLWRHDGPLPAQLTFTFQHVVEVIHPQIIHVIFLQHNTPAEPFRIIQLPGFHYFFITDPNPNPIVDFSRERVLP